jgi:flagellar basal-body rod modification protein FlgD
MNDKGNLAHPGIYKIRVEAGIDGINTVLQPDIQAHVESVSMGSGKNGIQLNLSGLGAVGFNQVKKIL